MVAVAEDIDVPRKLPRIGILDTARGVALIAMASYHCTWDFEFFGYLEPGTAETGWLKIYARLIASTFLFLAGVSLVLANTPEIRWRPYFRRLAVIVGAAAAISLVTFIGMRDEWIFFGILHCIAASSIIGLLFLRLPAAATLLAACILAAGIYVDNIAAPYYLHADIFDTPVLWWVGLSNHLPRSNDYVPIFPWLTAFLFGLGMAQLAVARGWLDTLAKLGTGRNLVARAGRHSLIFYLVHQPLLFGLVYLLSLAVPAPKPDPVQTYMRQCNASCLNSGTEALCRTFCQCTLDRLQTQKLFEPMMEGKIRADTNPDINTIANQCTEASE
jgi:uncharacterized membrane protein